MDKLDLFSPTYLHQRYDYNPVTGTLTWNECEKERCNTAWNSLYAGKNAAAGFTSGYPRTYLSFLGESGYHLLVHRVVWKMTYGTCPPSLDHINRNRADFRIINLREAKSFENASNRTSTRAMSGHRGILLHENGKWRVRIKYKYRTYHVGYFDSYTKAVAARIAAEDRYFGLFAPK